MDFQDRQWAVWVLLCFYHFKEGKRKRQAHTGDTDRRGPLGEGRERNPKGRMDEVRWDSSHMHSTHPVSPE